MTSTQRIAPAHILAGMKLADDNGTPFAIVTKTQKRGTSVRCLTTALDGGPYFPVSFPAGTHAMVVTSS